MAHDPTHARHGDAPHGDAAGEGHAHVSGEVHEHPTWSTYLKIAVILTVITAVEVSAYYIPAWEESRVYVPSMLIMSGVKFLLVVMFYMHLKYDHRLFRALFTGPLLVAMVTILALMFLFGHLAVRLGG